MGASPWVHLEECTVKLVTEKALLVEVDGQEHWLPKSHVSDADQYEKGDTDVTISITEWLAKTKGFDA